MILRNLMEEKIYELKSKIYKEEEKTEFIYFVKRGEIEINNKCKLHKKCKKKLYLISKG
jgi:hypothetical protein